MSSNVKKLSARERRAAEAKGATSARVLHRADTSLPVPRGGATAAPVPKSRRPALERDPATDCRRELSPRRRDDARGKDDATDLSRKRPREQNNNSRNWLNDRGLAASHLSKIVFPGTQFPPPRDMSKKDAYSTMALDCMKLIASFNELAINYEVSALSQTRQLANTRKACDEYKKSKREAEARVAVLETAAKETEEKRRERDGTFSESEAERKRLQREVSDLTARLDAATKLQDATVQKAVDQAKFELKAEYESRIKRAREKLKMINGQPWTDVLDLQQVRSNIEFLALLQSDNAPNLDDELGELKKQEEG